MENCPLEWWAAEKGRSQRRALRRKQRAACACQLTLQPGCSQFDDRGLCSKYSPRHMRPNSSTWPSKILSQWFTQKYILIWPWCCVSNFLELPSESDPPSPWVPTCYKWGAHCLFAWVVEWVWVWASFYLWSIHFFPLLLDISLHTQDFVKYAVSPFSLQSECLVCLHSCVWLFITPWTVACKIPLSMDLSRKKYWSGLSFPPPRNLPHPEIKPMSLVSPLQVDSLPLVPPGKPKECGIFLDKCCTPESILDITPVAS